jgi:hypothetical protein
MKRGDIASIVLVVIVWGSLLVGFIHPAQSQEPSEYMSEDWLFSPPFNETLPAVGNRTPDGYWLYNITIPYINGTGQYWVYVDHEEGLIEWEGRILDLPDHTFTLHINTSIMGHGWQRFLLKADIMPAYVPESRWRFERWFYIGH